MKTKLALVSLVCLSALPSFAGDQITRPYQSARSSAMGGVRITTGLYEENFWGNPARVVYNPEWRIQLPDLMAESTVQSIQMVPSIITVANNVGSGSTTGLTDLSGKNFHARIQSTFPGIYLPNLNRFSVAFAVLTSVQTDMILRRDYELSPVAIADVGPAITVGRTFGSEEELSLGVTGRLVGRFATVNSVDIKNFLQTGSLSSGSLLSDGYQYDFDFGANYALPWAPGDVEFTPGFSINNILGGTYQNINMHAITGSGQVPAQPRSFNFGVAAYRHELWIFSGVLASIEMTDIGNNAGSWTRGLHWGSELDLGLLSLRGGNNQGYWTYGLGLNLKVFQIDLSSYGEETTLNPGGLEERRYAVRLSFQI
jgi:hypothetical protein